MDVPTSVRAALRGLQAGRTGRAATHLKVLSRLLKPLYFRQLKDILAAEYFRCRVRFEFQDSVRSVAGSQYPADQKRYGFVAELEELRPRLRRTPPRACSRGGGLVRMLRSCSAVIFGSKPMRHAAVNSGACGFANRPVLHHRFACSPDGAKDAAFRWPAPPGRLRRFGAFPRLRPVVQRHLSANSAG